VTPSSVLTLIAVLLVPPLAVPTPPFSLQPTRPLAVELNVDLRCLSQVTTDRPHAEASVAPTAGIKAKDGAMLDATQLDENADMVSVARATRAANADMAAASHAACPAACASFHAATTSLKVTLPPAQRPLPSPLPM
jgi:hypothetical protein